MPVVVWVDFELYDTAMPARLAGVLNVPISRSVDFFINESSASELFLFRAPKSQSKFLESATTRHRPLPVPNHPNHLFWTHPHSCDSQQRQLSPAAAIVTSSISFFFLFLTDKT